MKTQYFIVAILAYFIANGSLYAVAEEHKPYTGSEAFERMKKLVGSWEGTMDAGKGPETVTASYKLTSADSAIVETVFEGTPHEMVSVYHDDSKRRLTMTHFCAAHNQPKLALSSWEKNKVTLDFSKDSDIDVAKQEHIHSASILFDGDDKMTQQWVSFENGKKKQVVEIHYQRGP